MYVNQVRVSYPCHVKVKLCDGTNMSDKELRLKASLDKLLICVELKEIAIRHKISALVGPDRDSCLQIKISKTISGALVTKLNLNTTYHLHDDGRSETTILIERDILRVFTLDYKGRITKSACSPSNNKSYPIEELVKS